MTSLVVRKPGWEELAFLQEDASHLLDETGVWINGVERSRFTGVVKDASSKSGRWKTISAVTARTMKR